MRRASALTAAAVGIVAAAWSCRLLCFMLPALEGAERSTAAALYRAELARQGSAGPAAQPDGIEMAGTEIDLRPARVLAWIGLGLGLCGVAAWSPNARRLAVLASAGVFLAGWIAFDAYFHAGLLRGLDLKLRLVGNEQPRLAQFLVLDGLLPAGVLVAAIAALCAGQSDRVSAD